MGNQQSLGGSFLPSTCVQGRRLSYGRYRQLSLADSETGSLSSFTGSTNNTDEDANSISEDDQESEDCFSDAAELENAILSDDVEQLQKLCMEQKVDINTQLNEKGETALILAVKLSQIEMVKILLLSPGCQKNCVNVQNFSSLDVALVTAFDNRLEPRQTICWEIIECLLQIGAEPSSKDAMMYVIRTSLKFCDEEFIYRLILLAQEFSSSASLHELLLQKLHRYQPVYIESLDPIFISASGFTIRLLKKSHGKNICHIVNSMIYYLDSYWHSRVNKISTFKKLIIYATGSGWEWTNQQLVYINRVCPSLGVWCKNQRYYPSSLSHISRQSFRRNTQCLIPDCISRLPYRIPEAIKDYIMLKDIDDLIQEQGGEDLNMSEIFL